jgi:hypothetical protein
LLGGWLGEHTAMSTPLWLAGLGAMLTAFVGMGLTRLRHLRVLPQSADH